MSDTSSTGDRRDDEPAPDEERVEQAGIVVGHRADDEPIITDRDPDPTRQEPTPTASGEPDDAR